jgi:hypothetical protein
MAIVQILRLRTLEGHIKIKQTRSQPTRLLSLHSAGEGGVISPNAIFLPTGLALCLSIDV